MTLTQDIVESSRRLATHLIANQSSITTVESCTGGMVGAAITSLPGSSKYYPGGFITYSNELKQCMVGVSFSTLEAHGAVSSQTAVEMARGGIRRTHAEYAIAITGIAGPDGGSPEKPVGTVWICVASSEDRVDCRRFGFPGNRDEVRACSCVSAIEMAIQMISDTRNELPHEHERSGA